MNVWALGCYDLKLPSQSLWELTFGQFYKLCDRMAVATYMNRYDISSLHASFINANSKNGRHSAKAFIGDMPILSDEIESRIKSQQIKAALKAIFPHEKGEIIQKKKSKKVSGGQI